MVMADNNNNTSNTGNSGLLSDFGYTTSNMSTNVDTRNLRPQMQMPELNVEPIKYPEFPDLNNMVPDFSDFKSMFPDTRALREDPETKKQRSSTEIPNIVNRIRQEGRATYADRQRFSNGLGDALREASKPKGLTLTRNDVTIDQVYQKLNSGAYIPRFENFVADTNNEERLARRQSTSQKWWRGVNKLVAKTALYGTSGVVNTIYGSIEAIKEGNFSAIYNNDYMKFMDDLDTRLDRNLANYYTQEEKSASFFRKMGTTNFWANDVLGGMAFTAGALVTESIFATLTGGTSLATAAGRMGLRMAGRSALRTAARAATPSAGIRSTLNSYLRGALRSSNVAAAVNNGRFIMTSAGWEASVESFHYMKEAEINYIDSFRNAYGRAPSKEELARFRADAASAGNTVFAANIGIVGLSNILQFGQYFGAGFDVTKRIDRSINKALGLGSRFNKAGNLERINPSKFRKFLGTTYNVTKRPFTEGVWEEGNQGAVSEAAKAWIASRYNPEATEKNIGVIDSLIEGFSHTYGTQEGRMEVGIGAIIGAIMGVGGGRRTGYGGITEHRQQSESLDAYISNYNELNVPRSGLDTMHRFTRLNQQMTAMDQGAAAEDNGDSIKSRRDYDMSLFTKFKTESEMGLLEDGRKNFEYVIGNMTNQEIAEEYGITEDEAHEYKKFVIEDYNERLKEFGKADQLAESLGANRGQFRDYLGMNIFLGVRAYGEFTKVASAIEQAVGNPAISASLTYYARLSSEGKKLAKEKQDLAEKVAELEKEIQGINARISEEGATEEYNKKAKELSEINQRMQDITDEMDKYRYSPLAGEDQGGINHDYNGFLTLQELDMAIGSLRKSQDPTDKMKSERLEELVVEMMQHYADYKSTNELLYRLRDRRFLANEERGIAKLIFNNGTPFDPEAEGVTDPDLIAENQKLEAAINKSLEEGTMTEEEAYTLRTFNRMRLGYPSTALQSNTEYDPISDERWTQYNDGEDLDSIYEGVAEKVYDEVRLSPREQRIYDDNKAAIDAINIPKGDSPMARLRRVMDKLKDQEEGNLRAAEESNNRVIEDAIGEEEDSEKKESIRNDIKEFERLRNDQQDGKPVERDEVQAIADRIDAFGEERGVDDFLDFVEQNRVIKKGRSEFIPVGSVTTAEDLVDHRMPPSSSRGGASFDNAQNIEMLTAKKDKSGNNMIISGMTARAFADFVTDKMGGTIVTNSNEKGVYTVTIQDQRFKFHVGGEHSTTKISLADIERLEELSLKQSFGFVFTLQPALASANSVEVLWMDLDGSLSVIPTNTTYGKNGSDTISDDDVLNTKVGDRLISRVDLADDYNKDLRARLSNASKKVENAVKKHKKDPTEANKNAISEAIKEFENARNFVKRNLVIKFINNENGEGRFVSVAKALPTDIGSSEGQKYLLDLREKAFNAFLSDQRTEGYIDVGTTKVTRTLPGRPSLNMRYNPDTGKIEVDTIAITPEAAEHIVTVGYMLDGKTYVKDKADFSNHPFMSLVSRNSKRPGDRYFGQKMPFVVIKHPNGQNYAYPVEVNKNESRERLEYADELQTLLDGRYLNIIERSDIMSYNTAALGYGVDPSYFVRLSGSIEQIRSDFERLIQHLREMPNMMDVQEWLNSPRSAKEIAVEDINININLEATPFHAPKIVIGGTTQVESEIELPVDQDLFDRESLENGPDFSGKPSSPDVLTEGTDTSQAEDELKKPC